MTAATDIPAFGSRLRGPGDRVCAGAKVSTPTGVYRAATDGQIDGPAPSHSTGRRRHGSVVWAYDVAPYRGREGAA